MKVLAYPFDSGYILKKKKSIKRELLENDNLITKKIALLSGSTIGVTKDILEIFLLNEGIKPIFFEGDYNRFYEEAVFDYKEIAEFNPDIIYIHTTVKNVIDFPKVGLKKGESEKLVNEEMKRYIQVWESLKNNIGCSVILNTFEYSPYRVMGNMEAYHDNGSIRYINSLNQVIIEYARENSGFYINDLNYQAASYGLYNWFDHSVYYLYKYPFAMNAIPMVCHNISNIIKSLFGKNKKALVVDLDNTLWGGVIGDDGVENIELGVETPKGMVFSEIQRYIKKIMELGVSLSVCSKNELSNAKKGFDHPASELNVEDFTVFKANWDNKNLNIKDIASEINIMDDSIVFIDDNPAERQLVREGLPNVMVPELDEPERYIDIIDKSGFFEITNLSEDDKKRNEYYRNERRRIETQKGFNDYTSYLESLNMSSEICAFNNQNIERVVQLINKTNQFNLTTLRMTKSDIEKYIKDLNAITICATLDDKFGSNGIVSCMIASINDDAMEINLWVMSCRVFKRELENAIFDRLVLECISRGIYKIIGKYYVTKKNNYVSKLYETLGFSIIEEDEDHSIWELNISEDYAKKNKIIEVNINGQK